jgi:hypothetical protein
MYKKVGLASLLPLRFIQVVSHFSASSSSPVQYILAAMFQRHEKRCIRYMPIIRTWMSLILAYSCLYFVRKRCSPLLNLMTLSSFKNRSSFSIF